MVPRRFIPWALALLLLARGGAALALTCQSNVATGDWNVAGTWTGCGGGTPGAADDVQIRLTHAITIPNGVAAVANSLTFTADNGAASLSHATGTSTLTVGAGGVTVNAPGNNNTKNWNINAGSATVNGALGMNGGGNNSRIARIQITTGSLDVNGNLTMTAAGAARTVIDMSGGAGNLFIAGDFSLASGNGTLTPGATSTVTYDSATTPVTVATGSSIAYNHLVIAKGVGNVANAAATGTLSAAGNLTVTSGTFNIPGITATITGTSGISGTLAFITAATGTKTFTGSVTVNPGGTWSNAVNANVVMGAGLTNDGTFTAGNGTYTLTGALTNSSTFNAGTGNFSLTGNFTNNGTFNSSTGTFTINGGAAQTIGGTSGATSFANLTLANASGLSLTGTHNVTVSTLLTLTTGAITTGTNVLFISNGSNIASAGGADFVIGNLQKSVATGSPTTVFEIGTGTNYTPVTLVFASVTTGGNLLATTTATDHPDIANSGLNGALSVNRYWTFANSGVVFTTFSATFTFVAGDLDGSADTTVFEVSRFSPPTPAAGTWSTGTVGTRTATSTQITGETGFGNFAIGQPGAVAGGIGRFNAYDTTTAGGAVTGKIMTKVASAAFNVDIIAIRNNRKDIDTGFTGTVRVELLDASDNSGTLDASTGCNSSWTVIQTITPDPVFVGGDNGRKTISVTENNAWREARFRIQDFPGATLTGCSTDALAIRPQTLTLSAHDATWESAGTARPLANTGASGGNVHKASTSTATTPRPFTLRVTPVPGSATNYAGIPTTVTGFPACGGLCTTVGTLTFTLGSWTSAGSGVRENATANYSEAGTFNLELEDGTFAIVDALDGTPNTCSNSAPIGRRACATGTAQIGRFVPDHFIVAPVNTPEFQTFGASCSGARSFTYIGQPFGYVTAPPTNKMPVALVTARNANGGTTTNYAGSLWKITTGVPSDVTQVYSNNGVGPSLDTSLATNAPIVADSNDGTGLVTINSLDRISYTRDTTTPIAPFNSNISLTVSVRDDSEADGEITSSTAATFSAIGFDSGNEFRYGRLAIRNSSGSNLVPQLVRLETQYFSGAPSNTFITNGADHCTRLDGLNIEMTNYTTGLLPAPNCKTWLPTTAVTFDAIPFSSGRAVAMLTAPAGGASGSVNLIVRLEPSPGGSPQTCTGSGVPVSVQGENATYLQGNWTTSTFTQNPTGRATFGVYRGSDEVIDIRENF